MRLPSIGLAAAALLLLASCAYTAAPALPAPEPVAGRCNAAPAQFAVGRVADAALELDAKTRAGARVLRLLRPNQVVTMEFSAERLNLTLDASGRVTRVNCG